MKKVATVILATLLVSILSMVGVFQWKKLEKTKLQGVNSR